MEGAGKSKVVQWGQGGVQEVALPLVKVQSLVVQIGHAMVLTAGGDVYTWGRQDDRHPTLGDGVAVRVRPPGLPHRVEFPSSPERIQVMVLEAAGLAEEAGAEEEEAVPGANDGPGADPIVHIASSSTASFAVSQRGRLYIWGRMWRITAPRPVLLEPRGLSLRVLEASISQNVVLLRAVKGAAGRVLSCLYVLGQNNATGTLEVRRVGGAVRDTPVAGIASSGTHFACCNEYGQVYTWGKNILSMPAGEFGPVLGVASDDPVVPEPLPVPGLGSTKRDKDAPRIVQVTCGEGYTLARSADGLVYAWGFSGGHGAMGLMGADDVV
eukprot:CAMPEP_0119147718 /NCGR_PEP_ID=MMETSP1310-20130426/40795_1 /TAXON_ID=464262 /ORGANISM="Genus nov. species nov., Strain RCC2339" /LENGTH=324 /DNA_ID=CAMNT_0007139699 /DNA_START=21 /DNA_END=991 /DNA_ORIENTATION=-